MCNLYFHLIILQFSRLKKARLCGHPKEFCEIQTCCVSRYSMHLTHSKQWISKNGRTTPKAGQWRCNLVLHLLICLRKDLLMEKPFLITIHMACLFCLYKYLLFRFTQGYRRYSLRPRPEMAPPVSRCIRHVVGRPSGSSQIACTLPRYPRLKCEVRCLSCGDFTFGFGD